jgi:tripartite-type tricarboxylate transporter receptor subunit TctC
MRFIVPFGRDGASDRAARAFAARMPCSIENLPGAGGLKGVERANALAGAREPVLLLGTPSTHILLPARLGAAAAPSPDFAALLGLGSAPNVLLVASSLGVRDVEGLVRLARSRTLSYASAGHGQTIHVCTALFCTQAGITMTHRAYDAGSATAYADLAAGNVHVYFDNLLGCRERIASGEVVALAVSSSARAPVLADVPTLPECGFDHALDVWLTVFSANLEVQREPRPDPDLARALGGMGLSNGPRSARLAEEEFEASKSAWLAALDVAKKLDV